jgi:hypothetical protein
MANPEDEIFTPENDLVFALAAPAGPGGPCFAGRAAGLFRSDDSGRSWQDAYASLLAGQVLATSAVALSPDFEHDRTVFAGVSGGVLRSTDGGRTWRSAIFPPPAPAVVALAVSSNYARDDTLFAGTAEDGIFISSDGGSTWTAWNFGLMDMNVLCLAISPDFARDETLFAGTTTGLFVSANGGRAWREVGLPVDLAVVLSLAISPDYALDRTVFAGTEEHGLLRSARRPGHPGLDWERVDPGLIDPINAILLGPGFPARPDVLALHGSQLYFSYDGGGAFYPWTRPGLPHDFEVTAFAAPLGFSPDAPVFVGGVGGRVLVL